MDGFWNGPIASLAGEKERGEDGPTGDGGREAEHAGREGDGVRAGVEARGDGRETKGGGGRETKGGGGTEMEGGRGRGGGREEEGGAQFAGSTTCLRLRRDPSRRWRQKEGTGGGERGLSDLLSITHEYLIVTCF